MGICIMETSVILAGDVIGNGVQCGEKGMNNREEREGCGEGFSETPVSLIAFDFGLKQVC